MKLILCRKCHDVFKLTEDVRSCACGQCSGKYMGDGLYAEYSGQHAVPVGFGNSTLAEAVVNQPKRGNGARFEAFVIPIECPTFKKVNRKTLFKK